jgi:hypothetical protein
MLASRPNTSPCPPEVMLHMPGWVDSTYGGVREYLGVTGLTDAN